MGEPPSSPGGELRLTYYPDPVLRRRAGEVTQFDDGLRTLSERMFALMEWHKGVGLAAPQVGVLRRLFVTNHVREGEDGAPEPDRRVWVNPRIEQTAGEHVHEEGCLSVPGLYAKVSRPSRFDIVYQDIQGREQRLHLDSEAGDFLAVVVQHEIDHLDGVLFLDHLVPAQLAMLRRRLKDMEKKYLEETGLKGAVLRR